MKFNKAEFQVLDLGHNIPLHFPRLGVEWLENYTAEKDVEILSMTLCVSKCLRKLMGSWSVSATVEPVGSG